MHVPSVFISLTLALVGLVALGWWWVWPREQRPAEEWFDEEEAARRERLRQVANADTVWIPQIRPRAPVTVTYVTPHPIDDQLRMRFMRDVIDRTGDIMRTP